MGITIRGRKDGVVRLRAIAKNSKNLTPVFARYGYYLSLYVDEQFETEGARLGTPWKPLSPRYAARKAADGFGDKGILERSGELRNSWEIFFISHDRVEFGSRNEKAIWHQYGTRRNGKRVNPPRKILKVTPELEKRLSQMIENYILRGEL